MIPNPYFAGDKDGSLVFGASADEGEWGYLTKRKTLSLVITSYSIHYTKLYDGFIRHHEAQIFPLMHRRHLFSGSAEFVLYDFRSGGHVNEDVIAYSNP